MRTWKGTQKTILESSPKRRKGCSIKAGEKKNARNAPLPKKGKAGTGCGKKRGKSRLGENEDVGTSALQARGNRGVNWEKDQFFPLNRWEVDRVLR